MRYDNGQKIITEGELQFLRDLADGKYEGFSMGKSELIKLLYTFDKAMGYLDESLVIYD